MRGEKRRREVQWMRREKMRRETRDVRRLCQRPRPLVPLSDGRTSAGGAVSVSVAVAVSVCVCLWLQLCVQAQAITLLDVISLAEKRKRKRDQIVIGRLPARCALQRAVRRPCADQAGYSQLQRAPSPPPELEQLYQSSTLYPSPSPSPSPSATPPTAAMRKGVGLGALTRTTHTRSTYTTHGAALQKSHIDHLTTQLSVFQSQLSAFARTHAAAIRSTPAFRHEFARMCAAIGVDPLITSRGRTGGGGGSFWAELLGADVGDFYFELAVRVVEVCRRTRAENGGLIAVAEVVDRLAGGEGDAGVGEEDVLRAVEALRPLGSGFAVVQVGRRMMVRSVPRELNRDQATVLGTIEICGFGVAASMLRVNLGWEPPRVATVLEDLVTEGLVWVDEQAEEREYWVPGVMGKK